ncbi:uncharacterized protein A4U43_C10F9100 [Asparagus officinalis]|uniref:Uncharacterized protein n=1 Tax=Asparagus officinalis TaxID=4686 RepID=A0A5P1E4V1_ASPOF|nr:uncharacterized protein A4U43_C10F9100 [Asparagus officinalis]
MCVPGALDGTWKVSGRRGGQQHPQQRPRAETEDLALAVRDMRRRNRAMVESWEIPHETDLAMATPPVSVQRSLSTLYDHRPVDDGQLLGAAF